MQATRLVVKVLFHVKRSGSVRVQVGWDVAGGIFLRKVFKIYPFAARALPFAAAQAHLSDAVWIHLSAVVRGAFTGSRAAHSPDVTRVVPSAVAQARSPAAVQILLPAVALARSPAAAWILLPAAAAHSPAVMRAVPSAVRGAFARRHAVGSPTGGTLLRAIRLWR